MYTIGTSIAPQSHYIFDPIQLGVNEARDEAVDIAQVHSTPEVQLNASAMVDSSSSSLEQLTTEIFHTQDSPIDSAFQCEQFGHLAHIDTSGNSDISPF